MRPIPPTLKAEMEFDSFYSRCCITGHHKISVKIDFHHNLIYAGRQVNEKWCILPLSKDAHDNIVQHKEKCDWIMLNRGTDDQLQKYSKAKDLIRERERLNKKYGTSRHKTT